MTISIEYKNYKFLTSEDQTILFLSLPKEDKREFLKRFLEEYSIIKEMLRSHGITNILDVPQIQENLLIIAQGIKPVPAETDRIEILLPYKRFLLEEEEKKVEEPESEEKDLRELYQRIICIKAGEKLAQYYPPKIGQPGLDIFNQEISPPTITHPTYTLGENLILKEETGEILAQKSGVLQFKNGVLHVIPNYVLRGDVDFSVGNIHFIGEELVIVGDIKHGFLVEAEGNLRITGSTENKVQLKVKGECRIDGILRGHDTELEVTNNLWIKTIEYAKITALGNVYIDKYSFYGRIHCKGYLYGSEMKLYGGTYEVEKGLFCKELGGRDTKTIVIMGAYRDKLEKLKKLRSEAELLEKLLEQIEVGIAKAEKVVAQGNVDKERILLELSKRKLLAKNQLLKIKQSIEEIENSLKEAKKARIVVEGVIYPNVTIEFLEKVLEINEEKRGPFTIFLNEEGEITLLPITIREFTNITQPLQKKAGKP